MRKHSSKILKVAEKFRRNAEKEMERVRALLAKSQRFAPMAESTPLVSQLLERLKQKELQSSGDLVWIDQYLGQARAQADAASDAAKPEAAGKHDEKKTSKSK